MSKYAFQPRASASRVSDRVPEAVAALKISMTARCAQLTRDAFFQKRLSRNRSYQVQAVIAVTATGQRVDIGSRPYLTPRIQVEGQGAEQCEKEPTLGPMCTQERVRECGKIE